MSVPTALEAENALLKEQVSTLTDSTTEFQNENVRLKGDVQSLVTAAKLTTFNVSVTSIVVFIVSIVCGTARLVHCYPPGASTCYIADRHADFAFICLEMLVMICLTLLQLGLLSWGDPRILGSACLLVFRKVNRLLPVADAAFAPTPGPPIDVRMHSRVHGAEQAPPAEDPVAVPPAYDRE